MKSLLSPLLEPLAKIFIAQGILFPNLAEQLKRHLVNAAIITAPGHVTDSWISVTTGLQRRDIQRLKNIPKPNDHGPNHLAKLVNIWATSVKYAPSGQPIVLPKSGPAPSFEALALSIRTDVHPRTMLDALLASRTVAFKNDSDMVELLEISYQPLAGSQDQLDYLIKNVGDHMAAACENVLAETPLFFERAAHFNHLSQDDIDILEADFREGQKELLKRIAKKASELQAASTSSQSKNLRFRAGGYFYHCKDNMK